MRFVAWVRAACTGCVVLGLAFGLVGTVATAAPAQTDDTLAAAAQLVGFIPKDVRYDCTIDPKPLPVSLQTAAGAIRVGLACLGTDGVSFSEYYLFATNAAMNSLYTQVMGTTGSQPVRSAAGNCPSDGTWDFAGQAAGRVGCYYTTGQADKTSGQVATVAEYAVNIWTYDAQNILAVAAMPPGNNDAVALQSWWNDKAGPTKTAADVSGVVSSDAGQTQFQRTLLTHIPAVTRKTCTPLDVSDPSNGTVYPKRLWIRAAEQCTSTGGADVVIYESIDPNVVEPYFASVITNAQAQETPTQADRKCPDAGTYTAGNGKHSRTVGEYACFTDEKEDTFNNGAAYSTYLWSYPKLGILAYATNNHNDPDALISWFYGTKSGPV